MAGEANTLAFGEHEIARARIHWGILLLPLLKVLPIGIAGALPILAYNRTIEKLGGHPPRGFVWTAAALLIVPAIAVGVPVIEAFLKTEYVVTSRHLRFRTGWLMRASGDLLLQDIEAILYVESLLGRLLGYGTVEVIGKGGTRFPLQYVPSVSQFRLALQDARDRLRTGGDPPRQPSGRPTKEPPLIPAPARMASTGPESPSSASREKPVPSIEEAWRKLNAPPNDVPPDDTKYMPKT